MPCQDSPTGSSAGSSRAAAVNFPRTTHFFRNAQVTGIPVRREFFNIPPRSGGPLRLLVFGGSQGARVLNEVMPEVAGLLLKRFPELEIVHQAGGKQFDTTRKLFSVQGLEDEPRLRVQPYLDAMVDEIAAADVVLCRSGASTVAELAAAGRASVLVPFAGAADDHQRKNADVFVQAGAARLILESELTPDRVLEEVSALLADASLRQRMGEAARTLAFPDAASRIARMISALALK